MWYTEFPAANGHEAPGAQAGLASGCWMSSCQLEAESMAIDQRCADLPARRRRRRAQACEPRDDFAGEA